MKAVQAPKPQPGPFDSGLTPVGSALAGGADAGGQASHTSVVHSSGSQLRSSASGTHPHSSQLTPHGTGGRLASVLDENVYLQDL